MDTLRSYLRRMRTRYRALLREEVARRFDVVVHESTIGKWLRQLGLTRLQARPFHPKKAAEAEATFKKTSDYPQTSANFRSR